MKVKEFLKKVNGHTVKLPVILEDVNTGKRREAVSFDFAGYYSNEQDKTIHGIHILTDKVLVYYK